MGHHHLAAVALPCLACGFCGACAGLFSKLASVGGRPLHVMTLYAGGFLASNLAMLSLFVRGQRVAGSVVAVVLNSLANIAASAAFGHVIFSEPPPNASYLLGVAMAMMGVYLLLMPGETTTTVDASAKANATTTRKKRRKAR